MQAVELFAGAGGLGMGVSQAGFKPVKIVEWDRWCCDTINENRRNKIRPVSAWPEPIHGDVRSVDFSSFEGKVSLVSGGPPCQPFSLGGKHKAHADKRDMWGEAVRAVREIKPDAFIFENVKGLTRAAFASYKLYIELQLQYPEIHPAADENWDDHLRRLERHHTKTKGGANYEGLRYTLLAEVLNAANYGVPQRRERIVFVGFRSDLDIEWNFPAPTHSNDALLWEQCRSNTYWDRHKASLGERTVDARALSKAQLLREKPLTKAWRTVRDAICDLPEPTSAHASKILNHRFQAGAKSYPGHTGSPLDEPAKTLKAGVHGVPGGENMLTRADGSVRYFTVRESARLQTFPDTYELHGSWSEAMRQLGNAVPVDLAAVVAKDVAKHLKATTRSNA
ncbi:DNA cytosine methyltransferase [Sphingomonas sp. OTU376]|uniref:DNA cytosine methyltransferase n=1 Tax=Sphingomonas sp. OTU376 TaxID=3043863 RepID=UPI00313AD9B1